MGVLVTPDEAGKENAGVTVVTPQGPQWVVMEEHRAWGFLTCYFLRPLSPEPELHQHEPHAGLTGKVRLRETRQVVRG